MTTVHGDWVSNFLKQFVPRLHCSVSVYTNVITAPLDIAETYIDSVEMQNTFAELATALPTFTMKITLNNIDGAFSPTSANYTNYFVNPSIVKVQFAFDDTSYMDPLYGNRSHVSFNSDETKVYLFTEVAIAQQAGESGFPLDKSQHMWLLNNVTLSDLLNTMRNNMQIGDRFVDYTSADTDNVILPFPIAPGRPDVVLQQALFGAGWEMQINRNSTLAAMNTPPYSMPELHDAVSIRESDISTDDPIPDYFIAASELQSYPVQTNGQDYAVFTTTGKNSTASAPTVITNTITYNYSFTNAPIFPEYGLVATFNRVIWIPFNNNTTYGYASVRQPVDLNVTVRNGQSSPYGVYLQAPAGVTVPDGTITVDFYGTLNQETYTDAYNLAANAQNSIAFYNDYGIPSSSLLSDYVTKNTTFSFSWWADPRLEAGDYAILKMKKTSVVVRILDIKYVYNGAMKATATARFVADYGNLSLYADDELHLIDYATPV